jgi:16S rRNA (cytosine1402-N4)-methyltransferase
MNKATHIPVLLKESISLLNVKSNGIYVDCTAGRGGHSSEILKTLKTGKLICLDKDIEAIEFLQKKFKGNKNVICVHADFANIDKVLEELNIPSVNGILADIGVSSPMFDNIERGFSYHNDSQLDMRMDQTQKLDAKFVLNNYDAKQLNLMFKRYGEIANPAKAVGKILDARKNGPIISTKQLVEIIKSSLSYKELAKEKHPAKQYFQAIRIEVNNELNNLEKFLNTIPKLLASKGVCAIISFHSLEDRIIKNAFTQLTSNTIPKEVPIIESNAQFRLLTKKPILPSSEELKNNYRAHSAKLRGVEKI